MNVIENGMLVPAGIRDMRHSFVDEIIQIYEKALCAKSVGGFARVMKRLDCLETKTTDEEESVISMRQTIEILCNAYVYRSKVLQPRYEAKARLRDFLELS